MDAQKIDGAAYLAMVSIGARNLGRHVTEVNDLNVFPIPDGDTGDNMMMTLEGGARAKITQEMPLSESAKKVADGMLLSARGNSGVILSQFFAGIAKGFQNVNIADVDDLAEAFRQGVKQAYESVMTPTEGTILTVVKDATNAACDANCDNCVDFMQCFTQSAKDSLERTPELLAVLKEAGVVDSGGAGLVHIAEGMHSYLNGTYSEEELGDNSGSVNTNSASAEMDMSLFGPDSVLEYGYCTEVLLRLQNSKTDISSFDVEVIRDYLKSIGNSIVCIQTDSIVKLHVHTLTPYKVLEFCQKYGEYLTVKIENMNLQHSEVAMRDSESVAGRTTEGLLPPTEDISPRDKVQSKKSKNKYGIVTVANGEGVNNDFKSFGANEVIYGGQTMNPSAEDFIEAYKRIDAEHIFVLPNNGNIIMAAELSASLYKDAIIHVLPTKSIGDAYAILPMVDLTGDDADALCEEMMACTEGVVTAEISPAIRDTEMNGVKVKKGDYIGIIGKQIVASEFAVSDAARSTLDNMDLKNHGLLIVVRGKDASKQEADDILLYLRNQYPMLEISESFGMQEVYPFIFIAE
ncbi:MAG: DAK2 domain-containing protein [Lachnospiraceae bacterium]|nr:DAK2 domain-containing protein [Candidatus Merdinaster equi]